MSATAGYHYVYTLQSEDGGHFYVGLTEDLTDRLKKHNSGAVPHSAKYCPWRVKTAVAFRDHARAAAFEKYLKSSSGRAFAKKRL
jgi:predicted GIY-YIG superfamily endonuclease